MRSTERSLSQEYYRRKQHVTRVRLVLVLWVAFLLLLLEGIMAAEVWALKSLLRSSLQEGAVGWTLAFICFFLLLYSLILARFSLYISYHMENARIAQTGLSAFFLGIYVVFVTAFALPIEGSLHLALGKLLTLFLFFRFWRSQLSRARLLLGTHEVPRVFLTSWPAFFRCGWVLAACWLLSALGFALGIVSAHPIIDMEGWEGVILMGTFFVMFRFFVTNPYALSTRQG